MQKGEGVLEQGCAGRPPLRRSAEELWHTGKAEVHEPPSSHPTPEHLEGGHGPGPPASAPSPGVLVNWHSHSPE